MRIGIAYTLRPADSGDDGPDDRFEEFDKPETIEAIADVIRDEGHAVEKLGDGREFLERVLDDPPDFVWNLAEGHGVSRNREARVPAVLEMLGVPYLGSDPLTLSVSLDKNAAKRQLRGGNASHQGVRTPEWIAIPPYAIGQIETVRRTLDFYVENGWFRYPLILKPVAEGSSKGIRGNSLAEDEDQAVALFEQLGRDYSQPVLFEQFIDGDELTVGVIGNFGLHPGPDVVGIMRIVPSRPIDRFVYSIEAKRDWQDRVRYEAPAKLPAKVRKHVEEQATAAYSALDCRDLARIDFRLKDGIPYFIEANPLPGLTPGVSDLVILAKGYGISYADLIRRILHAGLIRVGLMRPEAVTP